jgi:MoaA/NifB/PqqE/SkfB family radical SAM enzyme
MPTASICCYWLQRRFPDKVGHIRSKLAQWGGNSSGVNVANIDNLGNVHPDTMWWHYTLGNVRERLRRDLDGYLRPADGRPQGASAHGRRALRRLHPFRHLRRQHARARPADDRRSPGRKIRAAT